MSEVVHCIIQKVSSESENIRALIFGCLIPVVDKRKDSINANG